MTPVDEIRRILADWRERHGWQPGMVWDPYIATYVHPTTTSVPATGGAAQEGTT